MEARKMNRVSRDWEKGWIWDVFFFCRTLRYTVKLAASRNAGIVASSSKLKVS
jgi:hypothetical protein